MVNPLFWEPPSDLERVVDARFMEICCSRGFSLLGSRVWCGQRRFYRGTFVVAVYLRSSSVFLVKENGVVERLRIEFGDPELFEKFEAFLIRFST